MAKFKTGMNVKVVDTGKTYSTYSKFIKKYAPQYFAKFDSGSSPRNGDVCKVVTGARHLESASLTLYVIRNENTNRVFIVGESGLERVLPAKTRKAPIVTTLLKRTSKYAVGDKVLIRSDLIGNKKYGSLTCFKCGMRDAILGKVLTITKVYDTSYDTDAGFYVSPEMIEKKVKTPSKPIGFKVGDQVRVRTDLIPYTVKYKMVNVESLPAKFVDSMKQYAGMTGTVTGIKICGHLQLTVDNGLWCWADEMLEPVEKPTPKVKKEKLPMTKYGFTIGQKVVYRGEVREVIAFGKRSETLYVRLEGTPICEPSLADRPVKVKWMIVKPFEVTKFEKKKRPARRFTDEEIKEASVIISNLLVYYGNARTIKITEKGNATEVLVMRNMEITSGVSKNGRGDIYSPTIGLMIAMCRAFGQDRLIPKWIFK